MANNIIENDEHIIYPDTGKIWSKFSKRFIGASSDGYLTIWLNGKVIGSHRYIFEQYYQCCIREGYQVDHINNVRDDNRICNLQILTKPQNGQKTLINKNNTSGINGVSWEKNIKKWRSGIRYNNKRIHLGCYKNKKLAGLAYNIYANQLNKKYNCQFILNKIFV